MTSVDEVDDSIRMLIEELRAMENNGDVVNDNAVYVPIENIEQSQQTDTTVQEQGRNRKKSNSRKKTSNDVTEVANNEKIGGWTVRPANDAPVVSWVDNEFQYTVRNPDNYGNVLLKVNAYNNGVLIHSCGLYLNDDKEDEIYTTLKSLLTQLENMWVDRNTGTPKIDGITQYITRLSKWRQTVAKDCTTVVGGKRKRSAPRSRDGGSTSRDTQVRRENKRSRTKISSSSSSVPV